MKIQAEERAAAAEEEDDFDRIPDDLVLLILHKTRDATSLLRCLCVSRRFSSLVARIRSLHLSLPPPKPSTTTPTSLFTSFSLFFTKLLSKPLKHLLRVKSKSGSRPSPTRDPNPNSFKGVLKNFREVESVHVKLPCHAMDGSHMWVKWKAEFGRNLKGCVMMGATSLLRIGDEEEERGSCGEGGGDEDEDEGIAETLLRDAELKLRVVWIIYCLVSASARHHLVKQLILSSDSRWDHPELRSVVVSDDNNQGKLWMGREQLLEMKESLVVSLSSGSSSGSGSNSKRSLERTPVPELSIKMSHMRSLELPESGYRMKGATLVEVRAVVGGEEVGSSGGGGGGGDCEFDGEGEEKAFSEAVKEMLKVKKSYVMSMNAF